MTEVELEVRARREALELLGVLFQDAARADVLELEAQAAVDLLLERDLATKRDFSARAHRALEPFIATIFPDAGCRCPRRSLEELELEAVARKAGFT